MFIITIHDEITISRAHAKQYILPVAETGEIVFISAELLSFSLRLVLTEPLVDDRPDHVIVLHLAGSLPFLCKMGTEKNLKFTFKIEISGFVKAKAI